MMLDVLSPHQDDAAFSLALALGEFTRCGAVVRIINCFTITGYTPFYSQVEGAPRVRDKEDDHFAAELGGSVKHINLGRKDAPLRTGRGLRGILTSDNYATQNGCEIAELNRDISLHVARSTILMLPLAAGIHVDHCIVRDAAVPLCADRLFAVYEDLPYAVRLSNDEVQTKVSELEARLSTSLLPVLIGGEEFLSFKERCLRCYSSQIGERTLTQILDYSRRYGAAERLWMTHDSHAELARTGVKLVLQRFAPRSITVIGTM